MTKRQRQVPHSAQSSSDAGIYGSAPTGHEPVHVFTWRTRRPARRSCGAKGSASHPHIGGGAERTSRHAREIALMTRHRSVCAASGAAAPDAPRTRATVAQPNADGRERRRRTPPARPGAPHRGLPRPRRPREVLADNPLCGPVTRWTARRERLIRTVDGRRRRGPSTVVPVVPGGRPAYARPRPPPTVVGRRASGVRRRASDRRRSGPDEVAPQPLDHPATRTVVHRLRQLAPDGRLDGPSDTGPRDRPSLGRPSPPGAGPEAAVSRCAGGGRFGGRGGRAAVDGRGMSSPARRPTAP